MLHKKNIFTLICAIILAGIIVAIILPFIRERCFLNSLIAAFKDESREIIDMPQIYPGSWDKLIIMRTGDSAWLSGCDKVKKAINLSVDWLDERSLRIIFMENGKVIGKFEKQLSLDELFPELPHCKSDHPDIGGILLYERSEAKFTGKHSPYVPNCTLSQKKPLDSLSLCIDG